MAEIDINISPSQDINETPLEDATCKAGHVMSSAIQFPLVVHSGTTFSQFAWPVFVRPLDPATPLVVCNELNPLTAHTSSLPNERWTFGGYSRLRAQLLVLPCPSTNSVNNKFSQPLPSTSLSSNSSNGWPDSCPHETDLTLKLAGDVGPEALHGEPSVCSSTVDTTKIENKGELTETSSGTTIDGRSGISRFCVKDLTLMQILGTDQPSTLIHERFLLADSDSRTHVSSMTPCLLSRPSVRVSDKDFHHNKRFSDAAAATEARKRRKQLTKLKHLHGKQLKLHF
uniref:Uncharacterized protein n=6 Tax=Nymphaea colorata TaxID=210225 RepID=A0A5K0XDD4_9MAGN